VRRNSGFDDEAAQDRLDVGARAGNRRLMALSIVGLAPPASAISSTWIPNSPNIYDWGTAANWTNGVPGAPGEYGHVSR